MSSVIQEEEDVQIPVPELLGALLEKGGLRPAPHGGFSADGARPRRARASRASTRSSRRGHCRACSTRSCRRSSASGSRRSSSSTSPTRSRAVPLPRERLPAARRRRRRLPRHPVRDQGRSRTSACRRRRRSRAVPRGFVVVTGPTGSGKSTTLAAMVDLGEPRASRPHHDRRGPDRVPPPAQELRRQPARGRGGHPRLRRRPSSTCCGRTPTSSWSVRCATSRRSGGAHRRRDRPPGLRDPAHPGRAADDRPRSSTCSRPTSSSRCGCSSPTTLQGVVTQKLVPTVDGQGRVAAAEVLVATPAIRNLIREGKTHQIYSSMQAGGRYGMQTMDMALAQHVKAGADHAAGRLRALPRPRGAPAARSASSVSSGSSDGYDAPVSSYGSSSGGDVDGRLRCQIPSSTRSATGRERHERVADRRQRGARPRAPARAGLHAARRQAPEEGHRADRASAGKKVKLKEVAVFSRQFATMVNSGLSILRALGDPRGPDRQQGARRGSSTRCGSTSSRASSLSGAMAQAPRCSTACTSSMVQAGETGGFAGLRAAAARREDRERGKLRGKIKSAMTYPVVVFVLVILIIIGMLLFVVPQFEDDLRAARRHAAAARREPAAGMSKAFKTVLVHRRSAERSAASFFLRRWKKTERRPRASWTRSSSGCRSSARCSTRRRSRGSPARSRCCCGRASRSCRRSRSCATP